MRIVFFLTLYKWLQNKLINKFQSKIVHADDKLFIKKQMIYELKET